MPKKRSTATFAGVFEPAPAAVGLRGGAGARTRRCAALNRRGERCGNPAMRGKEVCRKHGGKAGRRPSTGLYAYDARKVSEEVKEKFERHLANPNITSLTEEIALARAYLEGYLVMMTPSSSQDPPPLTSEFFKVFLGFMSRLSRLAKSQAEIEWSPQHLITATQAVTFFDAVLDAVNRQVSSVEEKKRVFDHIEQLLGLAGLEEKRIHALPAPRPAEERGEGEVVDGT